MPFVARAAVIAAILLLLAAGVMAWSARGMAILMELGTGAARVLCL